MVDAAPSLACFYACTVTLCLNSRCSTVADCSNSLPGHFNAVPTTSDRGTCLVLGVYPGQRLAPRHHPKERPGVALFLPLLRVFNPDFQRIPTNTKTFFFFLFSPSPSSLSSFCCRVSRCEAQQRARNEAFGTKTVKKSGAKALPLRESCCLCASADCV